MKTTGKRPKIHFADRLLTINTFYNQLPVSIYFFCGELVFYLELFSVGPRIF